MKYTYKYTLYFLLTLDLWFYLERYNILSYCTCEEEPKSAGRLDSAVWCRRELTHRSWYFTTLTLHIILYSEIDVGAIYTVAFLTLRAATVEAFLY